MQWQQHSSRRGTQGNTYVWSVAAEGSGVVAVCSGSSIPAGEALRVTPMYGQWHLQHLIKCIVYGIK